MHNLREEGEMSKYMLSAISAILLVGCGCDGKDAACSAEQKSARTAYTYVTPDDSKQLDRVKIERISISIDALAYGGQRGIYIITDSKTGKEFIGISGVGIAETGSHRSGKQTIQDER